MRITENGSATSRGLGRPHPEERACWKIPQSSNARARVSKDEGGSYPLMLRDGGHSALKTRVNAL